MKLKSREKRQQRIRKKITGTKDRPRLSVFRSNRHVYAQVVDDTQQKVIIGVASYTLKEIAKKNKSEAAFVLGQKIAELAQSKGITQVAFDRSGYRYHGRVKAIAEGARKAGLKF